eukprot:453827-Hanusia_phi.AAC.1
MASSPTNVDIAHKKAISHARTHQWRILHSVGATMVANLGLGIKVLYFLANLTLWGEVNLDVLKA